MWAIYDWEDLLATLACGSVLSITLHAVCKFIILYAIVGKICLLLLWVSFINWIKTKNRTTVTTMKNNESVGLWVETPPSIHKSTPFNNFNLHQFDLDNHQANINHRSLHGSSMNVSFVAINLITWVLWSHEIQNKNYFSSCFRLQWFKLFFCVTVLGICLAALSMVLLVAFVISYRIYRRRQILRHYNLDNETGDIPEGESLLRNSSVIT